MFRRQDLRTLGVDLSVADPDLIDPVHQFGDEIKMKAGAAKGCDLLFGREDDLRVFNRVLKIVFLHCRSCKGTRSDNLSQMVGTSRCDVRGRRSAASLPTPVRKSIRQAL